MTAGFSAHMDSAMDTSSLLRTQFCTVKSSDELMHDKFERKDLQWLEMPLLPRMSSSNVAPEDELADAQLRNHPLGARLQDLCAESPQEWCQSNNMLSGIVGSANGVQGVPGAHLPPHTTEPLA